MKPRIARSVPVVPERKREGMSPSHLAALRALPCVSCGLPASEAHHLMRGIPVKERGTGRRSSDRYAIPLCRICHTTAHFYGDDEAYLAVRGVDGRAVAEALWRERGEPDAMRRIVERLLSSRRIYVE
jgi:hypothetical protein